MKKGLASKSGRLLLLISLLGLVFSILVYYFLNTIILSIGILVISIIFPYLNHRSKMKYKIKINKIVKIDLDSNTNTLNFSLINESYAQRLNELNINGKEKIKQNVN